MEFTAFGEFIKGFQKLLLIESIVGMLDLGHAHYAHLQAGQRQFAREGYSNDATNGFSHFEHSSVVFEYDIHILDSQRIG